MPAKPGAGRKPTGRPLGSGRKILDALTVERLAHIGATNDEIAAVCGCSRDTLQVRLKDTPALAEAIDRGRLKGKVSLRRMQWHAAKKGSAAMMIWLGKQMLDQRDQVRNEHTGADGAPLVPVINLTISKPAGS